MQIVARSSQGSGEAMPLPFEGDVPRADRSISQPARPPINGTTTMSRHASATGAMAAWKHRSPNLKRLRELWTVPRTLQQVSDLSQLPLASVCSLKSAIEDELMPVGFETIQHAGRRATKRTQWQLKTHVQDGHGN